VRDQTAAVYDKAVGRVICQCSSLPPSLPPILDHSASTTATATTSQRKNGAKRCYHCLAPAKYFFYCFVLTDTFFVTDIFFNLGSNDAAAPKP
jgi:hypothetical protein